jgi:hypothetical protein
MSDLKIPKIPAGLDLTQEQIDAISGGETCVPDIDVLTGKLKEAYENLVDFTSYVMERISTSVQ